MAQIQNNPNPAQIHVNQEAGVAPAAQQAARRQQVNVGLLGANQRRPSVYRAVKARVLTPFRAIGNQIKGIGRSISNLFKPAREYFKPRGGWQDQTISFKGQNITFFARELKSMAKGNRTTFQANIAQTLLDRITRGESLVKDVLGGNPPAGGASNQDIGDIMLFLSAKSRLNGNVFSEGAYTLEDPDGALYEFLDASSERYLRLSSHMESKQEASIANPDGVGTHTNMHRGIDLSDTSKLPSSKTTVLFAAIPQNDEPAAARRIFLKCEGFGCRPTIGFAHNNVRNTGGRASRALQLSDFGNLAMHAKDYIITRFQNDLAGSRKERIPTPVKTKYKALADAIASPAFRQNNPTETAEGVHRMIKNTRDYLEDSGYQLPAGTKDKFVNFLRSLVASLNNTDSLNARIGNEVCFSMEEILNDEQHAKQTNAQRIVDIFAALNISPAQIASLGLTQDDLLRIASA